MYKPGIWVGEKSAFFPDGRQHCVSLLIMPPSPGWRAVQLKLRDITSFPLCFYVIATHFYNGSRSSSSVRMGVYRNTNRKEYRGHSKLSVLAPLTLLWRDKLSGVSEKFLESCTANSPIRSYAGHGSIRSKENEDQSSPNFLFV